MEKLKVEVKDIIADTLFITLSFKAQDSIRKDTILGDTKSKEIYDRISYDFSKFGEARMSFIGTCIRSKRFDQVARDFIKEHDNPVVVILGCGLDPRKERIGEISSKAKFYQIDLSEVIDLRRQFFEEGENEHFLGVSMFDESWMKQVSEECKGADVLIIIEGVLMYLEEEVLRTFFGVLPKYFPKFDLHFDHISKWASQNSNKHDVIKRIAAKFKFGSDADFLEKWYGDSYQLQSVDYFEEMRDSKYVGFIWSLILRYTPLGKVSAMIHYHCEAGKMKES